MFASSRIFLISFASIILYCPSFEDTRMPHFLAERAFVILAKRILKILSANSSMLLISELYGSKAITGALENSLIPKGWKFPLPINSITSTSRSLIDEKLQPRTCPFLVDGDEPRITSLPLSSRKSLVSFRRCRCCVVVTSPILE